MNRHVEFGDIEPRFRIEFEPLINTTGIAIPASNGTEAFDRIP
jgi:hypothetical protein